MVDVVSGGHPVVDPDHHSNHLDDVVLLARDKRKLDVGRLAVLLQNRHAFLTVRKPEGLEVNRAICKHMVSQRVLVLVAHPLDIVPVDQRVQQPVTHHHQKGVASGHHLVELLVLNIVIVVRDVEVIVWLTDAEGSWAECTAHRIHGGRWDQPYNYSGARITKKN